jgi:hypothetical protein
VRRQLNRRVTPAARRLALAEPQQKTIFFDPVAFEPDWSWHALATAAHASAYSELARAADHRSLSETRAAANVIADAAHRHAAMTFVEQLALRASRVQR